MHNINDIVKKLYQRYGQFGEYEHVFPIKNVNTMLQIYRESKEKDVDFEKRLIELELKEYGNQKCSKGELDEEFLQPESVFVRIFMLDLILESVPEQYFDFRQISADSILGLTMSIAIYYHGLHTYSFYDVPITDTEKKNILGRTDFYIDYETIKIVRGITSEEEYNNFLNIFAVDINEIQNDNYGKIYVDNDKVFILYIPEFVDYIIYKIEEDVKKILSKELIDEYYTNKGKRFEVLVYDLVKKHFEECYHTVLYYPNDSKIVELDILVKNNDDLIAFECKSGTFIKNNSVNEEHLISKISNKTKKAYDSLKKLNDYFFDCNEYDFVVDEKHIIGKAESLICIHVSMYPMDFISSNLHVKFDEYYDEKNPILTLSYEHLYAILLDSYINKIDVIEYFKKRKKCIKEYKDIYFDVNELDLYYQFMRMNNDSMLNNMLNNRIIDKVNSKTHLIALFRDEYGVECRPSLDMLKNIDITCTVWLIKYGKNNFGLNKRYLKNLGSFLHLDNLMK